MWHLRMHELPPGRLLPATVQTLMFWRWPFWYLEKCLDRYGTPFTLQATNYPPLVFLSDPEEIRAVITARPDVLHPGEGAGTIEPLVGEGSFMLCDEEEHLDGRRVILPPLRLRAVQKRAGLVAEIVDQEVGCWPVDVPVALHHRLLRMTLQTILRTIFEVMGNPSDQDLRLLRETLLTMLSVTASPAFSEPLLRCGPGRRIWTRFLRQREEVDELIYSIIAGRIRSIPDSAYQSRDLLERLLRAHGTDGCSMSPRQVRDNLMSLVLAGHETTASQLTWAFQLLAYNPRVQRRLVEEIDLGVGDAYMTATVQEALRHRPVFLFAIPRAVKQPIEIGGWTHRPPAQLLACTYLLHHDPSIYPNPDQFRPERFLEGQPAPYTWMPWGGGRKRCPGSHLAMMEMKTVLRAVLERMTIDPASPRMERPRWRSVIVTPHAGGRVILRARRRSSITTRRLTPGRTLHDMTMARSVTAYDTRPAGIRGPSHKPIKPNTDFSQNV